MRVKRMAVLAALVLTTGLVVAPTTASANHAPTLTISQGAELPDVPGFSWRWMAPTVNVHRGTILVFAPSALLLPVDADAENWNEDNASHLGDPYAFQAPDPDDGLTALKYNNNVIFPTSFTCGTPERPCSYTGDVMNGGLFADGFAVEVDVPQGSYFYAQDPFNPSHRTKVRVVGNNDATTTQAEIDAYKAAKTATDAELAESLHRKMLNKNSTHVGADGVLVRDVFVGFDTKFISLFAMYPRATTIKKGQRIRYHFAQLQNEIHTATMPRSKALEIVSSDFFPQCDPDGDAGAGPDTNPTFDENSPLPICPEGSALEFETAPELLTPIGDGRYTGGNDVEHSGARSPRLPSPPTAGDTPFTVTFTRPTGKRAVRVDCAIHPGMINRVRVRRR